MRSCRMADEAIHLNGTDPMPQIQQSNQAVTQITFVEPESGKQAEALSLMTERARFMARQPGFISISLHRSLDGKRIVNYIQWKNRESLHSAHNSPEFRKEWTHFDELTGDIDPHLYEVACVMDGGRQQPSGGAERERSRRTVQKQTSRTRGSGSAKRARRRG